MELDSMKGLTFEVTMLKEKETEGVSAQVIITLGHDYRDGSTFNYDIDEEATLDLLRAARTWVLAHDEGITGPLDLDVLRVQERWTETESSIDLDTP